MEDFCQLSEKVLRRNTQALVKTWVKVLDRFSAQPQDDKTHSVSNHFVFVLDWQCGYAFEKFLAVERSGQSANSHESWI